MKFGLPLTVTKFSLWHRPQKTIVFGSRKFWETHHDPVSSGSKSGYRVINCGGRA
jgi:hypothetical protein